MLPMTITIMPITRHHGLVHASLAVQIPAIGATARITMAFPPEAGTGPADSREDAYDCALMVLNPE